MPIVNLILNILIVGLFVYSKLLPYKDKLDTHYRGAFDFLNSLFTPVFNLLKKVVKPFRVGQGLSVDMTQVILLIVFLLIINSI